MKFRSLLSLGLLSVGAAEAAFASTPMSVGGGSGSPAPIVTHQPPPQAIIEPLLVSPGTNYIWVAGHYSWQNSQWQWVPGAWVVPPQPDAVWVEGRWDDTAKTWTEGYWQINRNEPAQPSGPPPAAPAVVTPSPAPAVVVTPAPAHTTVIVTSAPPAPLREYRGHRPGRGFVWVDGYWIFDGHRHVWVAGRWERPPHGHRAWVGPRWEHRGGSYVFIQGYWR